MKAVFLDRDGTLVVERGYITRPDDIALIPGVAAAIITLRERGWKVFVVTNQGCVAKGMISEDELAAIHFRMAALLGAEGAQLDGIYFCPHHPDGSVEEYARDCDCRKPLPGLLERAASEHDVDLGASVMVGDTFRDLEAGRAVGAATVLVLTGKGPATATEEHGAQFVAADLPAALPWILAR